MYNYYVYCYKYSMQAINKDQQYTEEADLLKDVITWLEPQRRNGIKVIRICDRYHKGYSDLFLCVKGQFVVIELKDNIGTASPHQELFIKEMLRAGAIGGVCRTIGEVEAYIKEALNARAYTGTDGKQ